MKILALLGLLVVFVSTVNADRSEISKNYPRRHDDSERDDAAEDAIVEPFEGIYCEDDDGNYFEVNLTEHGEEFETINETEANLPNLVFFYLYTQNNPAVPDLIYPDNRNALASSHFNASKPTRIITHGWLNSYKSPACVEIRDAYLAVGDYNIIVVDWAKISQRRTPILPSYRYASKRVDIIAGYVAKMINYLETKGMNMAQLVLVGHSLGGHLVGLAGNQTTNTVGHIVAQSEKIKKNQLNDAEKNTTARQFDDFFFEDDDGNYIRANLGEDCETHKTIAETEHDLPNLVFFYLYTQNNPAVPDLIYPNNSYALASSHFNASKPTRIITHGWRNSHKSKACVVIRDAYLAHEDYNVIVVDWSEIFTDLSYKFAICRVSIVGGYIAKMIDFLETKGMNMAQLVLVGHSLGGHVVGLAGHQADNTVGYIVGLDPAGPGFLDAIPGERISHTDAAHVQIIHTNAGHLGHSAPLGHIDFWPNGGSEQLGCIMDSLGICAHSRAWRYFAESINSTNEFIGTRCDSWNLWLAGDCSDNFSTYMGGSIPTTTTEYGSYFFKTDEAAVAQLF